MSPASSGVPGHAHPVLAESQLIPWHSPAAAAAPKHSGMSPASSGVSGHVSGFFTSSGGWIDRTGWIGTSRVWQHTCASPAIRLVTWRIPIAFALDRIKSPLSGRIQVPSTHTLLSGSRWSLVPSAGMRWNVQLVAGMKVVLGKSFSHANARTSAHVSLDVG